MPKTKRKLVKLTGEELAYDVPAEVNLKKMRRVGTGKAAVQLLVERSKRTVGLDPDVAKVLRIRSR